MIKSPLRYPGGKSRAIKQIAPLIPSHQAYREPFLGGGSVLLTQKQMFPDRTYWVNDLYDDLYHFWMASRDQLVDLVVQVEQWKTEFKDGKALHRFLVAGITDFSPLQKAAAFFVLNRITFSGTIQSGGYSKQAFEKRFTTSSIHRLRALEGILKTTKITNLDYEKVVLAEGENVFIFLDPPYYAASKSGLYGKKGSLHKSFDHERFARIMQACPHQWLITYDNSDYIRELFHFAYIKTWNITYGMRNVVGSEVRQQASELFIANYPIG
ncbi:MAG: DNA adenine methylase [Bacteroidota bacterium]